MYVIALCTVGTFWLFFEVGKRHGNDISRCGKEKSKESHMASKLKHRGVKLPRLRPILTKGLMDYKSNYLYNIRYPEWSILIQPQSTDRCENFVNPHTTRKKQFSCLAVVTVDAESSYNLLRFENNKEEEEEDDDKEDKESRKDPTDKDVTAKDLRKDKDVTSAKQLRKGDIDSASTSASTSMDTLSLSAISAIPTYINDSLTVFNSGFFFNVANDNGRRKLAKNMMKLLPNLQNLEEFVVEKLSERGIKKGDDVVVMVVNAGEIDLLANFVCSCRANDLDTNSVIVFVGSEDLIQIVEVMGVIAVYHRPSFAAVPKRANYEYLDPIFIDMMWFKSFSVWLLVKLRYNVLFQDVDLVWFQNPFHHFREISRSLPKSSGIISRQFTGLNARLQAAGQATPNTMNGGSSNLDSNANFNSKSQVDISLTNIDAFLSDDGQRSLRYAPFYANSGFYYLISNPKTEYLAWNILTSFDLLHITGSHQNIFTIRLLEGLDISGIRTKMLSLNEFPSGVKFNHDKPYMQGIADRHERPYMFHMCWTRNKTGKLFNFRQAHMWYLTPKGSELLEEYQKTPPEPPPEQKKTTEKTSPNPHQSENGHFLTKFLSDHHSNANKKKDLAYLWPKFSELICNIDAVPVKKT